MKTRALKLEQSRDFASPSDDLVLTLAQYEAWRPHIFESMLQRKRRRRISLGRDATVVFENRDIVLFHLHERLRAEHVIDSERRERLLYEHLMLLPEPGELRATLFLDGQNQRRCSQLAERLSGPFSPVSLAIGGYRIRADVLDPAPVAVHYLSFQVADVAPMLDEDVPVSLCLAFDAGAVRVSLPPEAVRELMSDLGVLGTTRGCLPAQAMSSRWLQ